MSDIHILLSINKGKLAASTTSLYAECFLLSYGTLEVEWEVISWLVTSTNHGATRLTLFGGQGISGVSRGHFASCLGVHTGFSQRCQGKQMMEARLYHHCGRIESTSSKCRLSTRIPKVACGLASRHCISSQGRHPIP